MNFSNLNLIATSAFGLEGIISRQLKRMNMHNVIAGNGQIRFNGSIADAFCVNLRSRFADRVMILLCEKIVLSFQDLFQLVLSIPWEDLMTGNEKINISCKCARSQLMSPRDCQSVSKKSVIERLRQKTKRTVFPESGIGFFIHINIHENMARVCLDTSGEGLSRRGYRTWNGQAPLRETLASALVELSPWRPGIPLYDPCCGTGTILIEAALRSSHTAPGIHRSFAMESYSFVSNDELKIIRNQIQAETNLDRIINISGSDINAEAISLASRHVTQAGFFSRIQLEVKPIQEVCLSEKKGVFICNPPYGERLSTQQECKILYHELRLLKNRHSGWSLCAITSSPDFERSYGKKADRVRRLYNGTLECNFYVYL